LQSLAKNEISAAPKMAGEIVFLAPVHWKETFDNCLNIIDGTVFMPWAFLRCANKRYPSSAKASSRNASMPHKQYRDPSHRAACPDAMRCDAVEYFLSGECRPQYYVLLFDI
jgi:hypothetical protein